MVNATYYNMNITESPIGLVQYINSATMGAFGLMLLGAVWLFVFISLRGDNVKAFFAASFVTFLMSIIFRVLNMAPDWAIATMALATFGGFIFVVYQANRIETN
jgi:hypothetical protein